MKISFERNAASRFIASSPPRDCFATTSSLTNSVQFPILRDLNGKLHWTKKFRRIRKLKKNRNLEGRRRLFCTNFQDKRKILRVYIVMFSGSIRFRWKKFDVWIRYRICICIVFDRELMEFSFRVASFESDWFEMIWRNDDTRYLISCN